MIQAGFIGCGSMGSMLIGSFISSGGLAPSEIVLSTRTKSKLDGIRDRWPGIHAARSNAETARLARRVFVCVKPTDVKAVLDEILPAISVNTHIISIAGPVPMASIQGITGGAVSKFVPTVASEAGGGVTLLCHNAAVSAEDREFLEGLLGRIGRVKAVPEEAFDMAAELTSCMPGFIASIFREVVEAALRRPEAMSRAETEELVLQTLIGTARLLAEKGVGFDEAISRVATPGGVTEEGVKALQAGLPRVLDDMFEKTMEKRRAIRERVNGLF